MRSKRIVILLVLGFYIFQAGCAGRLINTVEVSDSQSRSTAIAFLEMMDEHQKCGCCLDAEVNAAISAKWWFADRFMRFNGYLQAMRPSFIKFVGVNPFGQPQLILATDGKRFQSVFVSAGKGYEGEVKSKTFLKYFPSNFSPDFTYYWLTGRLHPDQVLIRVAGRDEELPGYWLEVSPLQNTFNEWILFDPHEGIVMRHILQDGEEKVLMDVHYEDYQKRGSVDRCRLPGKITAVSSDQDGRIDLVLNDILPDVDFSEDDFDDVLPPDFERVVVD